MYDVKKSLSDRHIYSYLPAVLRENKSDWRIEYYVENPLTNELVRRRMRVGHILKRHQRKRDAKLHIIRIMERINIRLANGWNEFVVVENGRLQCSAKEVFALYLEEKEKELRPHSFRSYKSFVRMFSAFIDAKRPLSTISRGDAMAYLDDMYQRKKVSATTYNNHLKLGRSAFNWCVDKGYIETNPFEKIKRKPKEKKKRILIPPAVRLRITRHLEKENPHFLLICKLVYFSLLRPKEISMLRISDLHLSEKYISVVGDVSKNGKQRYSALSDDMVQLFAMMNLEKYPPSFYLFGSQLKPAKTPANDARYRKNWDKLRKQLKLPSAMQLYSLRDSGINEMLKSGIDNLSVMQHADHSSLDITTRYADHRDEKLIEKISTLAPRF